eukprot:1372902-Amphidinium_carterae.1
MTDSLVSRIETGNLSSGITMEKHSAGAEPKPAASHLQRPVARTGASKKMLFVCAKRVAVNSDS